MRTKYGLIAKVRWLAKGNPETMPHLSDLNYHQHMTLWVRPCVSIHKYSFFSLLINTLFVLLLSISLWKFISTKPTGQGFVTVHWFYWSSGEDSGLSLPYPDFNSWLRNQSPASNHCGLWPPKFKDTATSQQSATWKTVFTRTWPSWHPDLKFSAHRTVRNKFVSKKWLSLWYCYSSLNGQRQ